jgi:hypothetical protein
VIEKELKPLREDYQVPGQKKTTRYLCNANIGHTANIIREIGRLREITFREVGEGTNKSIDLDEYDIYYHHLFIWDTEAKLIVGAYRIGLGDEIFTVGQKRLLHGRSF